MEELLLGIAALAAMWVSYRIGFRKGVDWWWKEHCCNEQEEEERGK